MKICVYFKPPEKYDNFEGARLRKNIKGALESVDVKYVSDIVASYDVLHIMSSDDEAMVYLAHDKGVPVVMSALYGENDRTIRLTERRNEKIHLKRAARRVLNEVDLILVPTHSAFDFIKDEGITTPCAVVPFGSNKSRFALGGEIDTNLFYNYYQIDKNKRYFILIAGRRIKKNIVNQMIQIASKCKKDTFLYLTPNKNMKLYSARYREKIGIPKNLSFYSLASEEIYRSMIKNAEGLIVLDNKAFLSFEIIDAVSAKTPIFTVKPLYENEETYEPICPVIGEDIDDLADKITNFSRKEYTPQLVKAYNYASRQNLLKIGYDLKENYQELINLVKGV